MSDKQFKTQISECLRAVRKQQKLSLDAAAQLTGVSKAMLGQIERGESSPTIATLWKISRGLETSFSAFFSDKSALLSSEHSFPEDASMQVNTLFPFQADAGFEMFEITLLNFHHQISTPHSIGVIEHIHVVRGELNMFCDGQWHPLKPGETLRFHADQEHEYKALTESVVFQSIVTYPK